MADTEKTAAPPAPAPSPHGYTDHGVVTLGMDAQLRISTQREFLYPNTNQPRFPARLVVRRWWRMGSGSPWVADRDRGAIIPIEHARDFAKAVAAAVEHLEHQKGGQRG